jgi:uncharacterized protein (DUF2062 family)
MLFRRRNKPGYRERIAALLWPRKGFLRPFRYFAMRILRLNATPHAIAAGVAAGVVSSWTPFMGLHFLLSFALAYLIAGNMIAAALGTAFGNPLTFPFLWGTSWKIGNYMLGSATALQAGGIDLHHLYNTLSLAQLWRPVIEPMLLGSVPPAILSGLIAYGAVFLAARTFQTRRRERLLQVARNRMSRGDDGVLTV